MERSLSLILNSRESNLMPWRDAICLNLETMDARELDEFISKKFQSSDEIRKKYASKIAPFLVEHKELIEKVEKDIGRSFSGSIIITELQDNLMLERKKVIYKKQVTLFKQITKNEKFLLTLEQRDYINYCKAQHDKKTYDRLFTDYLSRELRFYCISDVAFDRISGQWRNTIKNWSNYYEIIRITLKEYEKRYKELGLDSLDVVYTDYLQQLRERRQRTIENKAQKEDDFDDEIELTEEDEEFLRSLFEKKEISSEEIIPRYRTYADEEGYLGDLDDWATDIIREDDTVVDYGEKGKTMTLKK